MSKVLYFVFNSYNVFIINPPYLTYKINVTVQQLDYKRKDTNGKMTSVWSTVGFAEIGPEKIGQNTNSDPLFAKTSSPKVNFVFYNNNYYSFVLCFSFMHLDKGNMARRLCNEFTPSLFSEQIPPHSRLESIKQRCNKE